MNRPVVVELLGGRGKQALFLDDKQSTGQSSRPTIHCHQSMQHTQAVSSLAPKPLNVFLFFSHFPRQANPFWLAIICMSATLLPHSLMVKFTR